MAGVSARIVEEPAHQFLIFKKFGDLLEYYDSVSDFDHAVAIARFIEKSTEKSANLYRKGRVLNTRTGIWYAPTEGVKK